MIDTRANRRKTLKKAVPLINDLDNLAVLFSLPTNEQVEKALKEALK